MRGVAILGVLFGLLRVAAAGDPTPAAGAPPPPTPLAPPAPPQPPEPPPPPPPPPEPPPQPPEPPHEIAAPMPAPVADKHAVSVTYDHGTRFATADEAFELKLTFRNQIRFESIRPTDDNAQFASHFVVPRARLQAEGNVFGKDTRYKLEFSFEDAGAFAFAKDLFVEQKLATAPVWIRAGHWKRPFNRQEMVSDFASEFNERANTATFVGGGRDLGVAVHNDYEKSPDGLEWVAGVFNGFSGSSERPALATTCTQNAMTGALTCATPTPSNFPADFGPALVLRGGWNVGKIKGYAEGDLEGGPLRWSVGASYKIDLANFSKRKEMSWGDDVSHGLEVDAMVKAQGFGLELGAYMMKLPASVAPWRSATARYGVLVQPGYFVIPKHGQVAGRFAYGHLGVGKQVEARAAFNWYWQGQSWKWATDVGFVKLTGVESFITLYNDKPELQLRSMLQLVL